MCTGIQHGTGRAETSHTAVMSLLYVRSPRHAEYIKISGINLQLNPPKICRFYTVHLWTLCTLTVSSGAGKNGRQLAYTYMLPQ